MSFNLYRENKLEVLARRFVDDVYNAPVAEGAPLIGSECTVVVQTRGMSEYLRQFIAAECSIAANVNMPFLNSFINQICRGIYGESFKSASLRSDQKHMHSELMKLLSDKSFVNDQVPELKKYLAGANCELKRWQLAGKLADLFDQYQLYRSDELYEKRLFRKGSFQERLYNELFDARHPGRDFFFEKLRREGLQPGCRQLPGEFSVFGVGALPPVYLDILVNLSQYCKVNFFYLSPCLEYWEYQLSRREQRQQAWSVAEAGNPILQALGRQGRSFFSALLANNNIDPDWEPQFRLPDDDPGSTMLEVMQHDILYLFDRRQVQSDSLENSEHIGRVRSDLNNDRSIAVHNCHSARRELEVLHDELLKLITQQGIEPHDVIVMAPDISRLAPVIDSVFGNGALREVYSIADLPPQAHAMASDAFHKIFAAASGRFEFSEIMALLDLSFVSDKLDLPDGLLQEFGSMLYESGVRWGFNGAMRKKFCGSDFDEFSWQMCMDRLLAGAACGGAADAAPLIGNVKAFDKLASGDLEYFARVVNFIESLGELAGKVDSLHTMNEWVEIFQESVERFFCDDNLHRTALMPLRSALDELIFLEKNGSLPGKYPLTAALAILDDHWVLSGENGRFLRGKITFCRMVPMRSIPHDVVAILDLNEGDFPRRDVKSGFDLIEANRKNGDRSMPVQDRYLLLEAIMSARKNLLFFYQGRSSRNNKDKPPCAPLSEVMQYLDNAFELKEYKHKLTGIDPEYFKKDAPYRSLDLDNFHAVEFMQQHRRIEESFDFPELFAAPEWQNVVSIDEMVSYFANPCCWIMRNQLGLYLKNDQTPDDDSEPWTLARQDNWRIDSLLLLPGESSGAERCKHALRGNLLPPGQHGVYAFEERSKIAATLPDNWRYFLQNSSRMPVNALVQFDDHACRIEGMVNTNDDAGEVLVYRFSSYKANTALLALLGSLTAAAAWNQPVGARMLNLGKAGFEERVIAPWTPAAAQEMLQKIFRRASEHYELPPPLFPAASVCYRDLKQAESKFYSWTKNGEFGDLLDENISRFYTLEDWKDQDFLDDFQSWAELLYSCIENVESKSDAE